jgi:hypothetical protein
MDAILRSIGPDETVVDAVQTWLVQRATRLREWLKGGKVSHLHTELTL